MECQGGIAQLGNANRGHADIDSFRLHVEAVQGNSGSVGAKELIAPGAAVAANDVNLRSGTADGGGEVGKQVENAWVVMMHVPRPMIPQEVIQLGKRFWDVSVPSSEYNINPLVGVRVKES